MYMSYIYMYTLRTNASGTRIVSMYEICIVKKKTFLVRYKHIQHVKIYKNVFMFKYYEYV